MINNRTISLHPNTQDLCGMVFGKLKVVSYAGLKGKRPIARWVCICECGRKHEVAAAHLKTGHTRSCGCRPWSRLPLKERIWRRVTKSSDGCWEWQGCLNNHGYGRMTIGRKVYYVHRLVYEMIIGKIPEGMFVLHHCDNPKCCRPEHLFLGDAAVNAQDCAKKGRHNIGERRPGAKLTWREVQQIRQEFASGRFYQYELAELHGVCPDRISAIVRGKAWKRVVVEDRISSGQRP